jgi:lysophospholipase L1-like esterase
MRLSGMGRKALFGTCSLLLAGVGVLAQAFPSTAVAAPNSYVALGDSYAAGPRIPNVVHSACQRSDHNYPSLVEDALHFTSFRDATCSGATTIEMTRSQQTNPYTFVPPQFDALGPDARVVSLTIGGNDLDFGGVVSTCLSLELLNPFGAPCMEHYTEGGTDVVAARIADVGPKVAAVLRGIHQRSPHAKVLLVGYIDILPVTGPGCWPFLPIAVGDFPYLRGVEERLNQMLAYQAAANGATFVDTYTPTIGHDACQETGIRWVERLIPTSPAAPVHPNVLGMQAVASAVLRALR